MKRICLISCVKLKRSRKTEAQNLYISPYFIKAREFASKNFDQMFILSAKYGLVGPNEIIQPYEKTLNEISQTNRLQWAKKVFYDLTNLTAPDDEITFIAGSRYREFLESFLVKRGNKVRVPLRGKSIGKQLKWMSENIMLPSRYRDLDEFYDILKKLERNLGGKRLLSNCTGNMSWPERGIYFVFDPNESRTVDSGQLRVVRIGTHMVSRNSKSTLWHRLHTHLGTKAGLGNHRASIFRLHVGEAIMNRSKGRIHLPTWRKGQSASADVRKIETDLEKQVSSYIKRMFALWLNIPDEAGPSSDRAYIEKNSIGLISNLREIIDIPSMLWLGKFASNEAIRQSGLWNINYIDYRYDKRFLDILDKYVDVTIGKVKAPKKSIAPRDWYFADKGEIERGQAFLFGEYENE